MMEPAVLAAGLYLLSNAATCTPSGLTVDTLEPLAAACLFYGPIDWTDPDTGEEVHGAAWRLCALPEDGLCLVDAYPGTVLMGEFE